MLRAAVQYWSHFARSNSKCTVLVDVVHPRFISTVPVVLGVPGIVLHDGHRRLCMWSRQHDLLPPMHTTNWCRFQLVSNRHICVTYYFKYSCLIVGKKLVIHIYTIDTSEAVCMDMIHMKISNFLQRAGPTLTKPLEPQQLSLEHGGIFDDSVFTEVSGRSSIVHK